MFPLLHATIAICKFEVWIERKKNVYDLTSEFKLQMLQAGTMITLLCSKRAFISA